ncbi:M15 family metallopeptidase [Mycobacterium sp. TNTM28]|uniref:M15 family metallopeptidase n=1 Tax=[Mycobacterium] fortunisiensis TaxID=2600579 RepID=A0ABS6KI61_9MYCO|nr:M15 family metallopeptidase [[Mycobacterium] fortunisiensis]MBU9763193.1 M15 family metallopeptidase [[Mycobacterium] fortunisiensis]
MGIATVRACALVVGLIAGCLIACAEGGPDSIQTSGASVTAPQTPSPGVVAKQTARVQPVDAAALGTTWRSGCPVPPADLRRITLSYFGFDGRSHRGELVVHRDAVRDVIEIFGDLRSARFPIEKMRTVDNYPRASDELSMQDNNTSAFNCRPLPSGAWSLHAYGRAVDINPLVNPYISESGDLQPKTARAYLDRARADQGMIRDGDVVVRTFAERGWRWGGHWRDPIDYQHFERR